MNKKIFCNKVSNSEKKNGCKESIETLKTQISF